MKRLGIVLILMGMTVGSGWGLEVTDQVKINELYYAGTPNYTYQDQFVELYNAGTNTAYLDGALLIRGVDTMGTRVYRFPGEVGGTLYPIAPGEFVVVAQDAYDFFAEDSFSVNLFNVPFETYCEHEEEPGDNPNVPNLLDAIDIEVDFELDHRMGQVLLATGEDLAVIPCPTG
jgi:hypothetical protein